MYYFETKDRIKWVYTVIAELRIGGNWVYTVIAELRIGGNGFYNGSITKDRRKWGLQGSRTKDRRKWGLQWE